MNDKIPPEDVLFLRSTFFLFIFFFFRWCLFIHNNKRISMNYGEVRAHYCLFCFCENSLIFGNDIVYHKRSSYANQKQSMTWKLWSYNFSFDYDSFSKPFAVWNHYFWYFNGVYVYTIPSLFCTRFIVDVIFRKNFKISFFSQQCIRLMENRK